MATRKTPVKSKAKAKAKVKAKAKAKTPAKAKAAKKAKAKAAPKKTTAKKTVAKKTAARKAPAKARSAAKKAPAKSRASSKKTTAKATPKPRASSPADSRLHEQGFTPYKMKRGEEYMNDDQKEHFKQILLSWRKELMEEVDRTVHHMQDEAANPPDPADRATLEEEFSIELRTRDRERRLIKKIDDTIELIANDDYGWCDSCGVEIGIRRLEARPTANKCIDCKTLDEIKEKQLGA